MKRGRTCRTLKAIGHRTQARLQCPQPPENTPEPPVRTSCIPCTADPNTQGAPPTCERLSSALQTNSVQRSGEEKRNGKQKAGTTCSRLSQRERSKSGVNLHQMWSFQEGKKRLILLFSKMLSPFKITASSLTKKSMVATGNSMYRQQRAS